MSSSNDMVIKAALSRAPPAVHQASSLVPKGAAPLSAALSESLWKDSLLEGTDMASCVQEAAGRLIQQATQRKPNRGHRRLLGKASPPSHLQLHSGARRREGEKRDRRLWEHVEVSWASPVTMRPKADTHRDVPEAGTIPTPTAFFFKQLLPPHTCVHCEITGADSVCV